MPAESTRLRGAKENGATITAFALWSLLALAVLTAASWWLAPVLERLAPSLFGGTARGSSIVAQRDRSRRWARASDVEDLLVDTQDLSDRAVFGLLDGKPAAGPRNGSVGVPSGERDRQVFTPEALLDAAGTLYIVAPAGEQAELAPVFETLVNSVDREVERRSATRGGLPIERRLLLMLDEAANIAPLGGSRGSPRPDVGRGWSCSRPGRASRRSTASTASRPRPRSATTTSRGATCRASRTTRPCATCRSRSGATSSPRSVGRSEPMFARRSRTRPASTTSPP